MLSVWIDCNRKKDKPLPMERWSTPCWAPAHEVRAAWRPGRPLNPAALSPHSWRCTWVFSRSWGPLGYMGSAAVSWLPEWTCFLTLGDKTQQSVSTTRDFQSVFLAWMNPAECCWLDFTPSACLDMGGDSLTLCFCWNSSAVPVSCYLIISSKFMWTVT